MAARSFSTLLTNVRVQILEPQNATPPDAQNTGQWSDTELGDWLNVANRELVERAELESAPANITTAAGTETYSLPSDFGRIRRVEIQDQGNSTLWAPLYMGSIDSRLPNTINGAVTGRGRPNNYFLYAGSLYLNPIPDAVYTVNLFYYRGAPDLVAGGDVSILPQRFHHLIEYFAIARAKQKIDDPGYVTYDQLYSLGMQAMLTSLQEERNTEGPTIVREV